MALSTNFNELSDSAFVDDKTLAELFATSTTTIWRRAARGDLPKPVRFSSRCTRWRVGDIRAVLTAAHGQGGKK